jgi:hypothetical protein
MHHTGYHEFAEPRSIRGAGDASAPSFQGADACQAAMTFFRDYARERPEVVTLWAFGIGFVLGWKMKPW